MYTFSHKNSARAYSGQLTHAEFIKYSLFLLTFFSDLFLIESVIFPGYGVIGYVIIAIIIVHMHLYYSIIMICKICVCVFTNFMLNHIDSIIHE